MSRALVSLLALPLFAGCGGEVTGAWLVELPTVPDETCIDVVDHDFIEAVPLAGTGDDAEDGGADTGAGLSATEEASTSTRLLYLRVESTGDGSAVLIMGEEAWLGARQADGTWRFLQSGEDAEERSESHESGYVYTESWRLQDEESITLDLAGDGGTGTWSSVVAETRAWTEPDSWSEAVGRDPGRIPAADYLRYAADAELFDPGDPVVNTRQGQECDDSPCRLSVEHRCETSRPLTLTRARY
ncbi:MAG: hypothetical protein D6798_09140 [Deltaproteobacteria bacterium]|nr:MAG: hypothetical protein D6798_09140 [Deltaproteobacteria bacterium]